MFLRDFIFGSRKYREQFYFIKVYQPWQQRRQSYLPNIALRHGHERTHFPAPKDLEDAPFCKVKKKTRQMRMSIFLKDGFR